VKGALVFDRRGGRKYLNEGERRAYFREAKREKDPASRAFCLILYYTGCRISEALNLTAERVDCSQKSLVFETLKQRKGGIFRAVPIPEALVAALGALVSGIDSTDRLFNFSRATAYRTVKGCMAKARVAGTMASPKGLRHGFAIACIARSIPLTTVQKWMGHARLETTAIYLDVSGDEEREYAKRLWS
jgi:integrase/recombinase XerD